MHVEDEDPMRSKPDNRNISAKQAKIVIRCWIVT